MSRAPSRLLSATKGAAASRLLSATKAPAASRLVSAVKRTGPLGPVLVLAAGCSVFTSIGDYDAQEAAPDTACCPVAPNDTYFSCDVLSQQAMSVGYTSDPVALCSTDIASARVEAVNLAMGLNPALTPTSVNCETPGCPAATGAGGGL